MSTEIAGLTMEIDSSSAATAAVNLKKMDEASAGAASGADKVVESMQRANAVTQKMSEDTMRTTAEVDKLQASMNRQAEALKRQERAEADAAAQTALHSAEIQKLLARYDPLGTKLRALQAEYAKLNAVIASGAGDDRQLKTLLDAEYKLNAEIAKTKGLMEQAGAGAEKAGRSMHGMGMESAAATRHLMMLGQEVMTGQFSQMPVHMAMLSTYAGVTLKSLIALATGWGALIAVVGLSAAAFVMGRREMAEMDKAIASTNNYAGITRGGMRLLAESMAESGKITIGSAKDVVTSLVASGQLGSQSLKAIASLAAGFARETGEDISKIGGALVKVFEDPAKGAMELNKSMHFLNAADIEHIEHLQRIGNLEEARLFLAEKVNEQHKKTQKELGTLEEAWNAVKNAASSAWDAMLGIGRTQTVDERIRAQEKTVAGLLDMMNRPGLAGRSIGGQEQAQQRLDAARALLADLIRQREQAEGIAVAEGQAAESNARSLAAKKIIDQADTRRIAALRDQLMLLDSAADSPDKARRVLEINKQIADMQRAMGADSRAAIQEDIRLREKLREASIGVETDALTAAMKMKQITQSAYDEQITALKVKANLSQQSANNEMLAIAGLTAAEKQRLRDANAILEAQRVRIILEGENQGSIEYSAILEHQRDSILAIQAAIIAKSEADIKAIDAAIAKQQEHNNAIGKTREQIELEREAVERLAIAQLQNTASAIEAQLAMEGNSRDAINILNAQLDAINELTAKRMVLANLKGDAATLQAESAALKEWQRSAAQTIDAVSRAAGDFLVNFVEKGSASFKDLWDNFKRWALRALAEIAVKSIAVKLIGGVSSAGAGGVVGGVAQGASMLGGISNLSSGAAALMSVFESLSAGFGMAAQMGFSTGMTSAFNLVTGGAFAEGIGAALGAIGPVGWVALAATAIWAMFGGSKGGPKTGGYATSGIDLASGAVLPGFTGDRFTTPNQSDAQVLAMTNQFTAGYYAAARGLGARGGTASFGLGFDMDPEGDAPSRTFFRGVVNGQTIYNQMDREAGRSPEEMQKAIEEQMKRMLFAALQASDLPSYIGKLFAGVDAASADLAAVDNIIAMAGAIKTVADNIVGMREKFEGMSAENINHFVDALGGLQSFMTQLGYINENFTTSAEKAARAEAKLAEGFDGLGLSVPKTHAEFLKLLDSFDLTTDAGRAMYASVAALAPLFIGVAGTAEEAAQALAGLIKSGQDFYMSNFASPDEVIAAYWQTVHDSWTKHGGQIMELTEGAFTAIPTTVKGLQDLHSILDDTEDGLTVWGQVMEESGSALVNLSKVIEKLPEAAAEAAIAIDNLFGGVNTGGGGVLTGAYGEVARIISQGLAATQGTTQDFGGRTTAQMEYIEQQQIAEEARWQQQFMTGRTDSWDQTYHDIIASSLNKENQRLAKELARYTILTAQYDSDRAEQFVALEKWFDQQQKALRGNDLALVLLQTTFDERWKQIVDGTAAGVDGTLSQLDRLKQQLLEWVANLRVSELSPLSPQEKINEASANFRAAIDMAKGGDLEAMGNVTNLADTYLNLAREFFASSSAYNAIFADVENLVRDLGMNGPTPAEPSLAASTATLAGAVPTSSTISSQSDIRELQEATVAELREAKDALLEMLAHIGASTTSVAAAVNTSADRNAQTVVEGLRTTTRR